MNIQIIFEDKNILVLNKPSGIVVHPYDFSTEETILDFVEKYSPVCFSFENTKKLQDGRSINLGGMVHKLDRDTSGVLAIAKNKKVFDELQQQFKNHTIQKEYIALVEGMVDLRPSRESTDSDSFIIDAPLGRSKKEYKQSVNPKNLRGGLRDAITEVHVLHRGTLCSLVKLVPKTGRTHQLRAHMTSIGHPIVGDKAYGSKVPSPRIMLHAKKLSFSISGKNYMFEALPEDSFENIVLETIK